MTFLAPKTDTERAGLRDFFSAYESNVAAIDADLMAALQGTPQLQAVVAQTPQAQQDAQRRAGLESMRAAILRGEWEALERSQRAQGAMYAALNVPFDEWFTLVSVFKRRLVPLLIEAHRAEPQRAANAILAMSAYVDQALSIIGDEYVKTKERFIAQQAAAIQELSTPVLQLKDRLLLVPIVGILDTARARQMTEHLLRAVRNHRAKVVVIDITGVPAVDSKVANHLFQTVAAARLMGARAVVTGLSAEVAQALVVLGVDTEKLNTVGDLQGGLEEAERVLAGASR